MRCLYHYKSIIASYYPCYFALLSVLYRFFYVTFSELFKKFILMSLVLVLAELLLRIRLLCAWFIK